MLMCNQEYKREVWVYPKLVIFFRLYGFLGGARGGEKWGFFVLVLAWRKVLGGKDGFGEESTEFSLGTSGGLSSV
jgi:hypothetical protein